MCFLSIIPWPCWSFWLGLFDSLLRKWQNTECSAVKCLNISSVLKNLISRFSAAHSEHWKAAIVSMNFPNFSQLSKCFATFSILTLSLQRGHWISSWSSKWDLLKCFNIFPRFFTWKRPFVQRMHWNWKKSQQLMNFHNFQGVKTFLYVLFSAFDMFIKIHCFEDTTEKKIRMDLIPL